jgi:uncharacterized protein YdaU (DUF1376 family)
MNFYKHHIGDYAQATGHLSFIEDAAYSRMIRKYYAEEKPLPVEVKAIQRLIGARTKEEKQAVEDILQEFFSLEADGWRNKRCDAEIDANRELDADRQAKNANEKERQRRHREERAKLFESLRGLNIVPPYDTKTETLRTLLNNALVTPPVTRDDIGMSQPVTPPVTRNATANQTPDSRLQTPDLKATLGEVVDSPPAAASIPAENPTRKGDLCKRLRTLGIDAAPHLQAWPGLLAGYSDEQILSVAEKARESKPGERIHLNYLVPMLADTKAPQARGSPPHGKQALRADYLRQQGYTGGENGDSSGERIIDGQAERVA